jgi:hypothetical protein
MARRKTQGKGGLNMAEKPKFNPEDVSLCPACSSMTHTRLGMCGKCHADKPTIKDAKRFIEIASELGEIDDSSVLVEKAGKAKGLLGSGKGGRPCNSEEQGKDSHNLGKTNPLPVNSEKPAKFPKLAETYKFAFGDEPLKKERIYERRKIMQAFIYILQLKGVDYGYDDFSLKVCGIHSTKLSYDLNKLGLLP